MSRIVDYEHRLFSMLEAATSRDSPLAGCCSPSTLYKLAREGNLPGLVYVGRKVFITGAGLRQFVDQGGAKP